MKKFGIIALAALLVVAFTVPASALENVFGGYWRTRFITEQNFSGYDDKGDQDSGTDLSRVDTRTRLYYTAVINDNLKFVNKFELDTVWGDGVAGDIGADGNNFELKNSYVDFTMGPVNALVGIHHGTLARGFLFDDDFSGMTLIYKGEGFSIPVIWMKPYEGGTDENEEDVDYYAIAPKFTLGEGISLNPYIMYAYSNDADAYGWRYHPMGMSVANSLAALGAPAGILNESEVGIWFLGLDADMKFGPAKIWFTGIMEEGAISTRDEDDLDISAYLLALGGSYDFGMFDIHGQTFYATGNDEEDLLDSDPELGAFWVPSQGDGAGQSYYWAEIMGYGVFDEQSSANSPFDKISNIWAINLGTKIKPMDKLTVAIDLWYADLVEERWVDANNDGLVNAGDEGVDDALGTEVDVRVTYELVEGLNLDVVGAYLFADDGTYKEDTDGTADSEDPWELGAQLSLSF